MLDSHQKFHIAYLCSSLGWGGLEMNHLRNALWMSERGHDVSIICTKHSPLHEALKKTDLRVIAIRKPSKHYAFFSAFQLRKKLSALKVTDLMIRSSFDMSIAASISFFSGRKIRSHFFMEMMFLSNKQQFFRTIRYSFLDSWVCSLEYMKELVSSATRIDAKKLQVIPSGLDFRKEALMPKELAREQLGFLENHILFGMIGRIDRKKRLDLAISALKMCQNPHFQLFFIGAVTPDTRDSYLAELQQSINEFGLEKQVHFLGFQENTSEYYRAMDAVIMASDFETFGMGTIEAMAQKTPVIGTNAGGSKELLTRFPFGKLISPHSKEELAQAMVNIPKSEYPEFDFDVFQAHFNHENICEKVERNILSKERTR
jgi:glycosyltransferase involved in cell wall biosynthesis